MLTIMRLIHDIEYNPTLTLIMISNGGPERSKYRVGRAALSDNPAVEPGIGVHIDDTISSGVEAGGYNLIEFGKIGRVQSARGRSAGQICPANRQSEGVEAFFYEVLHLPGTILTAISGQRWPDHG